MSAYGSINLPSRANTFLPTTSWPCKSTSPFKHLTIHHLTLSAASALSSPSTTDLNGDTLLSYTHRIFAQVLEDGRTYPQELAEGQTWESYTREAFEAYFWAADVFVAIGSASDEGEGGEGMEVELDVEKVRKGRTWEECVAGWYYVKPNYPGRASHVRPLYFSYARLHIFMQVYVGCRGIRSATVASLFLLFNDRKVTLKSSRNHTCTTLLK